MHQRQGKREDGKTSEKVKKMRGIEAQRVKHPNQTRANDVLIGGEEYMGKIK